MQRLHYCHGFDFLKLLYNFFSERFYIYAGYNRLTLNNAFELAQCRNTMPDWAQYYII